MQEGQSNTNAPFTLPTVGNVRRTGELTASVLSMPLRDTREGTMINEIKLTTELKKVWTSYCAERGYSSSSEDTDAVINITSGFMSSFVMERYAAGMDLNDAIHLALKYEQIGMGDAKRRKIIELLTPDTDFVEAYAVDESLSDRVVVASYDGHDLNLVRHKWDDLLKKYDAAIELVASKYPDGLDEADSDKELYWAWLEVAG